MSSREQIEAERAIADALFVLKCIAYNDQHLADIGRAIDLYAAGDFESAAILSTALLKRRAAKGSNGQTSVKARSLGELEQAFRASNKKTQSAWPS
jgi:hypothetical protein